MKSLILPILFSSAAIFSLTTKSLAQMGSKSTSIGSSTVSSSTIIYGVPSYEAKPVESINRLSVTTAGGGYVPSIEVSLPAAVILDSNLRIHDSVKHPREISITRKNARLLLIH